MPTLLQITDPGDGGEEEEEEEQRRERGLWLAALAAPEALHPLLRYTAACAQPAALAASDAVDAVDAGPALSAPTPAMASSNTLLLGCQVLLNLVEVAADGGQKQEEAELLHQCRRQLALAPEAPHLLRALVHAAQQLWPAVPAPLMDDAPAAKVHDVR